MSGAWLISQEWEVKGLCSRKNTDRGQVGSVHFTCILRCLAGDTVGERNRSISTQPVPS